MGLSPRKLWEGVMAVLNFRARPAAPGGAGGDLAATLADFSMEVMPRTAAKVADFGALLPVGTRVYLAHIDGAEIDDMVATAARLRAEGMVPMPHIPARSFPDRATLTRWVGRYREEAGVDQALLLAGGARRPAGDLTSSMELMETGLFDGFARLHVAGHPEGNRDIDPDDGETAAMAALEWKRDFARARGIAMAITTQFVFEMEPVVAWAGRLTARGIDMPVHLGVAGPAKLQTLIKFAIASGVGPSLSVLQKRARDVSKLVRPFEPTEMVAALAAHRRADPAFPVSNVHFYPFGGVDACAEWLERQGAVARPAASG